MVSNKRRTLTFKSIANIFLSKGYRLYTVVPRLLQVIDNLTNWYIRFNRKRLKGVAGLGPEDTKAALNTLIQVLFTLTRALAPFTPFITEHIYQLLKPQLVALLDKFQDSRSVHFLPFPSVKEALFDKVIERQVSAMQKVIQLGRMARERRNLSLKTPLLTVVVIADEQHLSDVGSLKPYILEELNVRDIVLTEDESTYNVVLEARVDWPTLGKKLKKDVQTVRKALPHLTQENLKEYQQNGKLTIEGIELGESDLTLVRVMDTLDTDTNSEGGPKWEPAFSEDTILLLDTASYPELNSDGLACEIINKIQRLRKKAELVPTDDVLAYYSVVANPSGGGIDAIVASRQHAFMAAFRGRLEKKEDSETVPALVEEQYEFGDLILELGLMKV